MKLHVYGLGRSGLAATKLALRQGHSVSFSEQRAAGDDITTAVALGAQRMFEVTSAAVDLCVAAPGVPLDHPNLNALRAAGTEVVGEVEWVFRTVPGRYVGVTGTAGKGTVTSWVAHVLQQAGHDAVAGGNLDPALAAVARDGATHVVELSSFQLERCPTFAPDIAVLLNLGVDHLDRHGTVPAYHAAKKQLLANLTADSLLVYNADDSGLRAWAAASPAKPAGFSLAGPAAAWLDGEQLKLGNSELLLRSELGVPGRHNVANALAAALTCAALGVPPARIAAGLRTFQGLPGRYSHVGQVGDVTFIEDSIATRPLAVAAALEATAFPVVWLAGGHNKGADISEFIPLLEGRVTLFIGYGAAGPEFCRALDGHVPTLLLSEQDGRAALRSALGHAVQHLQARPAAAGTVLLAPLAASFDQFTNYEERAAVFRSEVQALEAAWTAH